MNLTKCKFCKMKPKSFQIEAYTISETSRILGYKSTKTLYRLLNRDVLEDYIYLEQSGRVYLMLEPPNLPTLAEKIRADIQYLSLIHISEPTRL